MINLYFELSGTFPIVKNNWLQHSVNNVDKGKGSEKLEIKIDLVVNLFYFKIFWRCLPNKILLF